MHKNRSILRWLFIVFGPFLVLVVGLLARADDHFSFDKIRPKERFSLQYSKPYSAQEMREMRAILAQSYTYLTEGHDTYLFVSKDGEYVIKFFNMKQMTPKYWLCHIPFPWLDENRLKNVEERARARDELFRSVKIAFDSFRYQTGLMFTHLFKTDYLNMKVCVKDRWGIRHYIPVDEVPFVVQRRATPLKEHMQALLARHDEEEAIQSLCQILELVQEACEHGFIEPSDRLEDHYGFLEGRAILMCGRLEPNPFLLREDRRLHEVFRVSRLLERWTKIHHPELLQRLQAEIQDILLVLEEEELVSARS